MRLDEEFDWVVVQRILTGSNLKVSPFERLKTTDADKIEITRRVLRNGHTFNWAAELIGTNAPRLKRLYEQSKHVLND